MTSKWQKNSLTWGKRMLLVVIILSTLAYGVLSMAEKSKDALRMGLEDYLRSATKNQAQITDMISAELVPIVSFKMKGIDIRDIKNTEKTLLHMGQAYVSMPFLEMIWGGRKYIGFELKDVQMASGYIFPKKTDLLFAGISDVNPDANPEFLIDGKYNDLPVLITAQMDRLKKKNGALYKFSNRFPFTFKLGENEGTAFYKRGFSNLLLEEGSIVRKGQEVKFFLKIIDKKPLLIRGRGGFGDIKFNVELTKSDQGMMLRILSDSPDEKGLEALKEFLSAVRNDTGLSDKDFMITISKETSKDTKIK